MEETERDIVVKTGSAQFTLDRTILAPIVQAEVGGAPILDASRSQIVLVDAKGRSHRPRIERHEIETRGPVRATVCFDGFFEGGRRDCCRFCARLSFFAGSSLVRADLTLHNPRRARHRGGLWDLGDPGSAFFRDFSLRLGLVDRRPTRVQWVEDPTGSPRETEAGIYEIYQDSSGGENWRSRNHVNHTGEVPVRFRGYRVRMGDESSCGLRASPVVSIHGPAGTVAAAIPEFWQQFPKAIDTEGGTLNLRFFPRQFSDTFELQGGEQKTHTAWINFSQTAVSIPAIDTLRWIHQPVRVHCRPEWYAEARVIPYLSPSVSDPSDRYEAFISGVVDGPRRLVARREIIDEYGWRNYGEVYADHEAAYYKGEAPVISHYNNQYDTINGLLLQYLRTGDPRWYELADPLARHVMDIDIYHTDRDKAAYNGGLFWHTNHYQDARTCTHRSYSRYNFKRGDPFVGGGPSSNHNYSSGLLHYHYLTGDPGARELVVGLGLPTGS